MKKQTGYRLHWESQDAAPTAFETMAQVRAEIRRGAREGEITVGEATRRAYLVTEAEYQNSITDRTRKCQLNQVHSPKTSPCWCYCRETPTN